VSVYESEPESDYAVSQGDIFPSISFVRLVSEVEYRIYSRRGFVVSRNCVCDRAVEASKLDDVEAGRLQVTMAPVYDFSEIPTGKGFAGHVRGGRVPRYFYLDADGDQTALVADLAFVQPITVRMVLARDRIATLTPEWRARFKSHLVEHFTREEEGEA
jgi:hypothetical protein